MDNRIIYMVTYKDDNKQKHITFVAGYSQVKFIKDRFGEVTFEATEKNKQFWVGTK